MGEKMLQVRSARQTAVSVQLLDDEIFKDSIDKRAIGWVLFDKVCEHLNLIERDYFGLNFTDESGMKCWVNNDKKISKQLKGLNWYFNFEVKFYPPDPAQLLEDLTRYQLCLQLRRDIVNEKLPGSFVTYTLLGSYTAQSELGDYDAEEFGHGTRYLKDIKFAPYQDKELLQKIAELHRHHKGQTPEQAELNFLENAKKLSRYGVELHKATDAEGTDIYLGVCASGLIVYKKSSNKLEQINRFVWPKVLKMSYRRNKYYVKIRPGEFEHFASLIGFRLQNVKLAKRLWKISVEHHSFFRFREPEPTKSVSLFPRFGSRFRYSGRTQFQTKQAVTQEDRPAPEFDRVLSKRGTFHGRTAHSRSRDDDRLGPVRKAPPAVAPKPQVKPKPAPRAPSVDDNVSDKESLEPEIDRSFDETADRKSKMEKMHAVATPLAAVMMNSQKKEPEENHRHDSDSNSYGPPGYESDDPVERRHRRQEHQEEVLVETIDQGVAEPAPPSKPPMSLKERKMMEKQEKERVKREKEEEKRRKKEEEKEKKRLEKEKKALIAQEKKAAKQKSKQKGKGPEPVIIERQESRDSREAMNSDIGRGWEEAVNQEPRSPATPERNRKRLSSFEDLKKAVDKDEDRPPTPPASLPPKTGAGREDGDHDSVGGSDSASGSGSWHTDDDDEEEETEAKEGQKKNKKDAGRRDHAEIDGEEVSF